MKENKVIGHNFDFQGKTIRHARLVDCEIVGGNGGSGGGSGSGCDCPYKAGTPVLIDQLPENPDGSDFELTKAELAAAFGITEQDVDSIFEFARPYIGVYDNVTQRNNMFSLNSCGYDNDVTYVVYSDGSTEVAFASLSGSYTYHIERGA